MGLIKAVVILTISIILSGMFVAFLNANKTTPVIKQLEPYLNDRARMIIVIMVILMILT